MNKAQIWIGEKSQAIPTTREVLITIARRMDWCMAQYTVASVCEDAKISKRALYRALSELERLGEIARVTDPHDRKRARAIHLPKYCKSRWMHCPCATNSSAKFECRGKVPKPRIGGEKSKHLAHVSGLKDVQTSAKDSQNAVFSTGAGWLFPRILSEAEAKKLCEACRGDGWKDATGLNSDGEPSSGVNRCYHQIAAIAGRWRLAPSWADNLLPQPVKPAKCTKAVRQVGFSWKRT